MEEGAALVVTVREADPELNLQFDKWSNVKFFSLDPIRHAYLFVLPYDMPTHTYPTSALVTIRVRNGVVMKLAMVAAVKSLVLHAW